jgi:hypothetical protein
MRMLRFDEKRGLVDSAAALELERRLARRCFVMSRASPVQQHSVAFATDPCCNDGAGDRRDYGLV